MANTLKIQKKNNVHQGHRIRKKEKYNKFGIDSLHPHEVLEILLFFGIPRKDTNETAHELIDKFGSLAGVLEADIDSLKSVKNMTDNAAVLIHLVLDIAKLYNISKLSVNNKLSLSENIKTFLTQKYFGATDEKTLLLLFDSNNCMVGYMTLNEGGTDISEINIGKIVKIANIKNVTRVAIAHNHPDNSSVSTNDIVSSKKIAYHLKSVGIELIESFVITQNKTVEIFKLMHQTKTKRSANKNL